MTKYDNGDAVIENCLLCGATFEESQKIGTKISCDEEEGGCGNTYKLSMYAKTNVKEKPESED